MIVTTGAVERNGLSRSEDLGRHVVQIEGPRRAAQNGALGFHLSDEIPGAGSKKTDGYVGILVFRPNDISGNLLLQEAKVGLVLVKRLDDVIPIPPSIGPAFVPFEPMSVGIMGEIKPVLGHSLTKTGMVKQAVNQFAIGIGVLIGKKGIYRLRGGREPMQVVGEAADQSASVGFRRNL